MRTLVIACMLLAFVAAAPLAAADHLEGPPDPGQGCRPACDEATELLHALLATDGPEPPGQGCRPTC